MVNQAGEHIAAIGFNEASDGCIVRGDKEGNASADRSRLAACEEVLDCSSPGTTKLSRLEENLGGASIKRTAEDVRGAD